MIATIVPQVQGVVASANIVKNILAGLVPSVTALNAISILNKDLGGFVFDYKGEEALDAGVEITDHYTEDNTFMQDHRSVKPAIITMRGFVAEVAYDRKSIAPTLLALSSALATVTPYLGQYAPGATAKMTAAVTQTDQIINQLAQISGIARSITKLVPGPKTTKVQQAYAKLDTLRNSQIPFAVVTPWAVFGDIPDNGHGPMLIENLRMVSPDQETGVVDIIVRMKEIRMAPSLITLKQDNARGSQVPTKNGTVGKH